MLSWLGCGAELVQRELFSLGWLQISGFGVGVKGENGECKAWEQHRRKKLGGTGFKISRLFARSEFRMWLTHRGTQAGAKAQS
jgi:hypothetical protein